jgi:hypothetical protein
MHAAVLTRFAAGTLRTRLGFAGLVLVAVVMAGVVAAGPAVAADPLFPIGSRVGLSPPGRMEPSSGIRGFEDRDAQAKMLVIDMPGEAYSKVEQELAPGTLQKQGMAEDSREPVTFAAGKGLLIVGHQQGEGNKWRKWIFLAAVSDLTALVAVQVPEEATAVYSDAAMRTALTSLVSRPSVPIDEQLKLVPIRLGDLAGLRAVRVLPPGAVFLTDGPNDTLEAAEQPLLAISLGAGGPESAPDRDNFARNLLSGMAEFKDMRIVSRDMLKLGAMPTHEIQAEGVDAKSNAPLKFVQWVRFGNGGFVRLLGIARSDVWRDVFPRFRAVRDGLSPPQ